MTSNSVTFRPDLGPVSPALRAALAPHGVLRSGTNLSNFLLVTGRTPEGDPIGVSPDMARAIADYLGVGVTYVCYKSPGELADQALNDQWDIGLIGAEPQRAEVIGFTEAYCEIEATYLVPEGSPLTTIAEVDQPGVSIAVTERTAYGLWLDRNIAKATLMRSPPPLDNALKDFLDNKRDALAGLRPKLISDVKTIPGARLLDGRFMAVQQAIGVPRPKADAALDFLARFVEAAISSGFVAERIAHHKAEGLSVASRG